MISSLHFQHFPQHPCNSQQCLQHCMLFLTFESTYQIILWRFLGLLSLQARLLPFWVSTIFQSLYKSWYFSTFSFTLTSAGAAISMNITFRFLVNYNYVWSSCLYHIVTLKIDIPQNFHLFIFYCSFWNVLIPLSCLF